MVYLRDTDEIAKIRASAQLVAKTLDMLGGKLRDGVSTAELDAMAETFIRENGGRPAFKGYRGFPSSICSSVNEEVVHGIPGGRTLHDGDIISIDVGVEKDGYYGDSARTFVVGSVDDKIQKLLQVTREALGKGIEQARAGNRIGDISHAIQSHAEANGFFSRERARGARHRQGDARRAERAELRAAESWAPSDVGAGTGHRADGQRGRSGRGHTARWLDGRDA